MISSRSQTFSHALSQLPKLTSSFHPSLFVMVIALVHITLYRAIEIKCFRSFLLDYKKSLFRLVRPA